MQDLWVNRKKKKKKRYKVREIFRHCTNWLMVWQSYSVHLHSAGIKHDVSAKSERVKKNYNRELSIDVKIASLWFTELNNSSTFPSFPNRKYEVVYTYAKNCSWSVTNDPKEFRRMADVVQNLFSLPCIIIHEIFRAFRNKEFKNKN